MKKVAILLFLLLYTSLLAGEGDEQILLQHNMEKFALIESSFQSTDSVMSEEPELKSPMRAALYSAVIPGTGQYYAGSIWKAILFFGIAGIFNYIQSFISIERGSDMIYINAPDEVNETLLTFGEKSFFTGQNPILLYFAIVCLALFSILMTASIWKYNKNKAPKL